MATIKWPFGADRQSGYLQFSTLKKIVAASAATSERTIAGMFSYLRSATATKRRRLKLVIPDELPPGSLLFISHAAIGAASGLQLGTGFKGMNSIGAYGTVAEGTGDWMVGFVYNGDNFVPFVRDNQARSYSGHPLANKGA